MGAWTPEVLLEVQRQHGACKVDIQIERDRLADDPNDFEAKSRLEYAIGWESYWREALIDGKRALEERHESRANPWR